MYVLLQLLSLTLLKTAPILLAGMGGVLCESGGVINFALEGMMLTGAFFAVWAAWATGSPWAGFAGGLIAGAGVGLIHAVAALKFRVGQVVGSIALNLLAAGVTGVLLNQVFEVYGTSPPIAGLPTVGGVLPSLYGFFRDTPMRSLFGLSVGVPLAFVIAAATASVFKWSVWGLRVGACGENPFAAASVGLHVPRLRLSAAVCGGALAGLGGACLSIGDLSRFVDGMTQGRGYLAVAAVILGRWKPEGVVAACLFFGFTEAFSEWLSFHWTGVPGQLFLALPYAVCIGVLFFRSGGHGAPSALGLLGAEGE